LDGGERRFPKEFSERNLLPASCRFRADVCAFGSGLMVMMVMAMMVMVMVMLLVMVMVLKAVTV
jgi:hypothetical protein